MRTAYNLLFLSLFATLANAQIYSPAETAKRKTTDRANNAIDRGIDRGLDRGLDKIEQGVGSIFKKKEKPAKEEKTNNNTNSQNKEPEETGSEEEQNSKPNASKTADIQPKPRLKANSKFDFISGEKIIGYDDFSETAVGDFPLGWNTNSSAEIITFENNPQKWLFMSQDGFFQPDFVKDMPENFTLEYDIFTRYRSNNLLNYNFYIYASSNPKADFTENNIQNGIYFNWSGGIEEAGFEVYEKGESINKNDKLIIKNLICVGENYDTESKVHFSIWRQKSRLRVYVDEVKVLDIPKAFDPQLKYNAFKLGSSYMNYSAQENKDEYMVTNVRYAVGAPDTRSKLITEGRFSTTGILFDVNSDRIKAESVGTLKEIAKVLQENPEVKVKIIGHTDSDGDEAKNLDLSKRRATAVKTALSTEFGIAATRLETDGKGESQPNNPNTTPQGKANNRRVEFVKL
jgi:OmpA-OmpF porin, OOP family